MFLWPGLCPDHTDSLRRLIPSQMARETLSRTIPTILLDDLRSSVFGASIVRASSR